jgi:plasmid maintenance system antidote protein VapI
VNGEELLQRLDGRPCAWLAERLEVSARAVRYWLHGERAISEETAARIRALLPLSQDQ